MRRLVGAVTAAAALAWASAASAACSVGIAGEIKLALSHGLPVIEAVIEGKPAKLILGVGGSVEQPFQGGD